MNGLLTKATDRFSETTIDAETVVMSLDSGDFFSLSGTARAIWELLDGTRDRAALIAEVADQYGVAGESIANEVDAFLTQLDQAGLIRLG
ncbi:MAG: HPr-rel-A system PqqD family peptide chaperone [Novosphingobium sp.]